MSTDNYKDILLRIAAIKEERGEMYRHEPKDLAPVEALEGMVLYKAYRAFESLSIEKKIDEYRDLANYAIFVLEQLEQEP
jgi:hypothetical protein